MPVTYQYWIKTVVFLLFFLAGTSQCFNTAPAKLKALNPTSQSPTASLDFEQEVERYKKSISETSQLFTKKVNGSFGTITVAFVLLGVCFFMIVMLIFSAYVVMRN